MLDKDCYANYGCTQEVIPSEVILSILLKQIAGCDMDLLFGT